MLHSYKSAYDVRPGVIHYTTRATEPLEWGLATAPTTSPTLLTQHHNYYQTSAAKYVTQKNLLPKNKQKEKNRKTPCVTAI